MNNLFDLLSGDNRLASWLVSVLGIALLGLVPALAHVVARRLFAKWKWTATGVGLGLIALPASCWLYLQFFVDPVLAVFWGFPGLFLLGWHLLPIEPFAPGTWEEAQAQPTSVWVFKLAGLATLVWCVVYGFVGYCVDRLARVRPT